MTDGLRNAAACEVSKMIGISPTKVVSVVRRIGLKRFLAALMMAVKLQLLIALC